jgi:hypothetical protein
MTGLAIGINFSLFLVFLTLVVLFVWTWLSTHGISHITHGHVDMRAGDEGED